MPAEGWGEAAGGASTASSRLANPLAGTAAAIRSAGAAPGSFVCRTDFSGNEGSAPYANGTRLNRGDNPDDDEQPANAASAIIAATHHSRDRLVSLSSIGWRRGPGRGGTLCKDSPLPAAASQGEVETARSKNSAVKNHTLMDTDTTRFDRFNTRSIVRKGCADSSKIRLREPKLPVPDPVRPHTRGEAHLSLATLMPERRPPARRLWSSPDSGSRAGDRRSALLVAVSRCACGSTADSRKGSGQLVPTSFQSYLIRSGDGPSPPLFVRILESAVPVEGGWANRACPESSTSP